MSTKLSVQCFGGLRIEVNDRILSSFETDKSKALLAYLAIESQQELRRSRLAGLFWPDESEERALHNLRQTLSSLRKTLKSMAQSEDLLLADRDTIKLNPQIELWVDCLIFKQEMQRALINYQSHVKNGLFHIRALKHAMALFTGEFLANYSLNKSFLFEEWMLLTREEYTLLAIKGFMLLSIYHEKRSEYHQAIEYTGKIISLCPWDETVRNRIVRLLGVDHQWTAAKKHYLSLIKYLETEIGVTPTQESQDLYQQICLASEGKTTILPEYEPAVYYLPLHTTTFIGRAEDLDTVMQWLITPEYRLVTLTGLGGIGKTRFALEIAEKFVGMYRNGVFFVSLLSATDAAQIVPLIAGAMGIKFTDQFANQKQLLDHLREKEVLLILDNFEHLLCDTQSTVIIDALLTETRLLKILVTSREILNLVQEQVYLLSGLHYPETTTLVLADLQHYDAIHLFIRRASQKMPRFILNEKNYQSIMRICHVLEGLPLGVELAAATLCEQGCLEVAEKYEKNLGALTTRMTNFHTRHRSLAAAFEISWNLLPTRMKNVMTGLSFFLDGFTTSAAEEVTGATPDELAVLTSKSLLRVEAFDRYGMHEVIRQLIRAGDISEIDVNQIEMKHALHYAKYLSEVQPHLYNENQRDALRKIQTELGNLTLSWQWLVDHGRMDLIGKSMDSMYYYFKVRSLFDEGITWFKRAVDVVEKKYGENQIPGSLLWRLGALSYTARDHSLTFPCLLRSETILAGQQAEEELAYCRIHLGWAYQREKEFDKAKVYAELCLAYFLKQDDDQGLSEAYILIGSIENRQGNYQSSHPYFEKAYFVSKKTKNSQNLVIAIIRLADIACYEGNYENARALYQEALQLTQELNDLYHQAILFNNLGTIDHVLCHYEQAGKYYEESLTITRHLGDLDGVALALNNLGELATWQQDYDRALGYSQEALDIARKLNENWTIIVCLNSLGEIYTGMEMLEKGKAYLVEALQIAISINGLDLVARVLINLARIYQLSGERERAIEMLMAGAFHSATEQDSREKAQKWLGELSIQVQGEYNDVLMQQVINRFDTL